MSRTMLIDASHPEETRVAVVDGNRLEELDFESAAKRQIRGNVYLARVTRVEPSLQAAFVEYGGNRHGFLAFSEIHPDYYQIPLEDRKALLEAEKEESLKQEAEEEEELETSQNSKRSQKTNTKTSKSKKSARKKKSAEVDDSPDEDFDTEEETKTDIDEVETTDDSESVDTVEAEVEEEQEKMLDVRRKRMAKRRYKIQEVIKRGQILLIQAVKEERGNKGAAVTTYLSLAGRYCVLMPNTPRGGGISRKIANGTDRKRLKKVMSELSVPQGMGLIVRTAGAKRTKAEIKRDYNYLSKLWDNIRDTTLKSIAPALIHEEGNLVKRSIRDLYGKDIDKVLVQGEAAYKTAKNFMKLLMPSHTKNVQHYKEAIPLFLRYQVENQIEACLEPVAQLKSGGYLVIHPTEALVSVDVNSGRSTKERNVERTALKTNLEAAEEVARQMRLRDLAGLVVIDFIDMDHTRNNKAVERKMREVLSQDRARVQMGRISQFGLMELSRQRRRRSLLEGSTSSCAHCDGVGRQRSIASSALKAVRAVEEIAIRGLYSRIRLLVTQDVADYLLNEKRILLNTIEDKTGLFTEVVADPELLRPNFTIEGLVKSGEKNTDPLAEIEKEFRKNTHKSKRKETAKTTKSKPREEAEDPETLTDEDKPKKRSRRRGRRGGRNRRAKDQTHKTQTEQDMTDTVAEAAEAGTGPETETETGTETGPDSTSEKPKTRKRQTRKAQDAEKAGEKKRTRKAATKPKNASANTSGKSARSKADKVEAENHGEHTRNTETEDTTGKKAVRKRSRAKKPDSGHESEAEAKTQAVTETPQSNKRAEPDEPAKSQPEAKIESPKKPKRRGWWQRRK